MLTVCSNCNRVKLNGSWSGMKLADVSPVYVITCAGTPPLIIDNHKTPPGLSHGICPPCALAFYPELKPGAFPDPDSVHERDQRALAYLSTKSY